jgi:hypothetical protein
MPERQPGMRCGNDPRVRLTDGDRQVVAEFREYLTARREGMPPTPSGTVEEPGWREVEEPPADAPCAATFREGPMPDTVYCQERGHHGRHTSGGGSEYYVWLDGDEGAGTE